MQIELKVRGVSEIVGGCGMSLLMLTDEPKTRQMAIICEKNMGREVVMRITCAPMLSRRLPEVLIEKSGITADDYEICIYDVYDGEYKTALHHKFEDTNTPIRVSDGVLLAIIAHLSIKIEQRLFYHQSVAYDPDSHGMALPINVLSTKMLQAALDKAVSEENYEMASQLRDEINKRKDSKE